MSQIANLSNVAANAEANALALLLNSGKINIYSGTQPANANSPLASNTLLAQLTFGNPAFGTAVAGVITANPIGSGTAANTGTASFARIYEGDGTTAIMDVQVGTSGAGINLNTTAIVSGATVSVTSFMHSVTET